MSPDFLKGRSETLNISFVIESVDPVSDIYTSVYLLTIQSVFVSRVDFIIGSEEEYPCFVCDRRFALCDIRTFDQDSVILNDLVIPDLIWYGAVVCVIVYY